MGSASVAPGTPSARGKSSKGRAQRGFTKSSGAEDSGGGFEKCSSARAPERSTAPARLAPSRSLVQPVTHAKRSPRFQRLHVLDHPLQAREVAQRLAQSVALVEPLERGVEVGALLRDARKPLVGRGEVGGAVAGEPLGDRVAAALGRDGLARGRLDVGGAADDDGVAALAGGISRTRSEAGSGGSGPGAKARSRAWARGPAWASAPRSTRESLSTARMSCQRRASSRCSVFAPGAGSWASASRDQASSVLQAALERRRGVLGEARGDEPFRGPPGA